MYQSCHYFCINSVITHVSILSLLLTHVSILSLLLTHVSILSLLLTHVSILSLLLTQFCHRSCINSVIVPVSILSSFLYRCINPVTTPASILTALFLKATVTFKLKHSYPPAGIHFHVGLTWMLDLNLSAAAYDLPFVIVLAAIPIGCYCR